jgi:hypothetical protein
MHQNVVRLGAVPDRLAVTRNSLIGIDPDDDRAARGRSRSGSRRRHLSSGGGPPRPGPPTPPEPPALLGPPLPSRIAWPPGPLRTAMRMSVIFKSDAIEFRLTFWGYASRSAQRPSPAAAAPMPRNLRRPIVPFVDITLPFATKTDSRLEPVNSIRSYVYVKIRDVKIRDGR